VLVLTKVVALTPIEAVVPALGVRTVPKFWKVAMLLKADPFAKSTTPVLLKLPPPKLVVPFARNVPLFRNPASRALDKPLKLVAPFALNVPELVTLKAPLKVVNPAVVKVPALVRLDKPLMLVVPLVRDAPPARLLKTPPTVLAPLVDHIPALLTALLEPSNESRPVKVPALLTVAGPPDVEMAKSLGEFAIDLITPPALLVIPMAPMVLVAEIIGLVALPGLDKFP